MRTGCRLIPAIGVLGIWLWLAAAAPAWAQVPHRDPDTVASISGQFLISRMSGAAAARPNLNLESDSSLLLLKPAVLAVDAEHFKHSLWRQLGVPPNTGWTGKIEIAIYPAQSTNDRVTIASVPFLDHWNYRVNIPDRIPPARFARTLSGVLLLEFANRNTRFLSHSAEVPAWLVDGMAQQVLGAASDSVLFSAPVSKDWRPPVASLNRKERGIDPLASAREIVQAGHPLSFDELSWPTDDEMSGGDGGAYYASAQLFVAELLTIKNGPGRLRAMLAGLPGCLNWQTAFFRAYEPDFKRPVDVEKWWALRTIIFAQRDPSPRWTAAASVARLRDLLLVPVNFRGESNALPTHAEVPLQNALASLPAEEREQMVITKMRDLAMAELRMAPPFGTYANAYRLALADFLGELRKTQVTREIKHGALPSVGASVRETIGRLNSLDARRLDAENRLYAATVGKVPPGSVAPRGAGQ